jgi:hypothetical protein
MRTSAATREVGARVSPDVRSLSGMETRVAVYATP